MVENEPGLLSLLDAKDIEEALDALFTVLRHPICIIDNNADVVAVCGDLPRLQRLLQTTEPGKKAMKGSYRDAVRVLFENKKDQIYVQHTDFGTVNIWACIEVEGKKRGAIGLTWMTEKTNNNPDYKLVSGVTGISAGQLEEAFPEVPQVNYEEIKRLGTGLFVAACIIPDILRKRKKDARTITELGLIYNATKILNSQTKTEEKLMGVIELISGHNGKALCSIALLKNNQIYARYPNSCKEIGSIEKRMISEVVNARVPLRIDDVKKDIRTSSIKDGNVKAAMAFPLIIQRDIFGVISFIFMDGKGIHEANEELLSMIADRISIALYNLKEFEQAKEDALIDGLTGLYNRGFFIGALRSIASHATNEKPLSICLIDIDDFKHYNDSNGHLRGDYILKEVADIIKAGVRAADIPGRYGGEEFIILFPETGSDEALGIVDKIRAGIEHREFCGREAMPAKKITISVGIATCMDGKIGILDIIENADKALYSAKRAGKNRCNSILIIEKNLPPVDLTIAKGMQDRVRD